jgi:hypothetical protein
MTRLNETQTRLVEIAVRVFADRLEEMTPYSIPGPEAGAKGTAYDELAEQIRRQAAEVRDIATMVWSSTYVKVGDIEGVAESEA